MRYCDLAGKRVVVTRPRAQAQRLAEILRTMGALPVVYSGLEIVELDVDRLAPALALLPDVDLVIFVSPNAVRFGMKRISAAGGLPAQARVAAVGQGTAGELKKFGLREIIMPPAGNDSEALAACAELTDVSGQSVLIVRGEGGRDVLANSLKHRGASVVFLECYRRGRPSSDFGEIEPLWTAGEISAWTATSSEILDNMFDVAGECCAFLRTTPLFVTHPRIAARAFSRAVETIFVTSAGDTGLAAGLATWFCRMHPAQLDRAETP